MTRAIVIVYTLVLAFSNAYSKPDHREQTEGEKEIVFISSESFLDEYRTARQKELSDEVKDPELAAFYLGYLEVAYDRPDLLSMQLTKFMERHRGHTHFVPYTKMGFTKVFAEVYQQLDLIEGTDEKYAKAVLMIYKDDYQEYEKNLKNGFGSNNFLDSFDEVIVLQKGESGLANDFSTLALELMKSTSESSSPAIFAAEGDQIAHEVLTSIGPELQFHLQRNFEAEINCSLRLSPKLESTSDSRFPDYSFAASELVYNQMHSPVMKNVPLDVEYFIKNQHGKFYEYDSQSWWQEDQKASDQFRPTDLLDPEVINWLDLLKTGGVYAKQHVAYRGFGWIDASMTSGELELQWLSLDVPNRQITVTVGKTGSMKHNLSTVEEVVGSPELNTKLNIYNPPTDIPDSKVPRENSLEVRLKKPGTSLRTTYLHFDLKVAEKIARQFNLAKMRSMNAATRAVHELRQRVDAEKDFDIEAVNQLLTREFSGFNDYSRWISELELTYASMVQDERARTRNGLKYGFFEGFNGPCSKFFSKR